MPWNAIGFRTAFEAAAGTLFGLVPLPEARLERHSVWYHTLGRKLWYQAQWGSSGRLRGGTKRNGVPAGGSAAVPNEIAFQRAAPLRYAGLSPTVARVVGALHATACDT